MKIRRTLGGSGLSNLTNKRHYQETAPNQFPQHATRFIKDRTHY
jgi:hypothetical protein